MHAASPLFRAFSAQRRQAARMKTLFRRMYDRHDDYEPLSSVLFIIVSLLSLGVVLRAFLP
jgi:hypothetical protein